MFKSNNDNLFSNEQPNEQWTSYNESENLKRINLTAKLISFCLLKIHIPGIKANINFINQFRHKMAISNEEDYLVFLYLKAIKIIESLESTIEKGEILNLRAEAFKALLDEEKKRDVLNSSSPNLNSKLYLKHF